MSRLPAQKGPSYRTAISKASEKLGCKLGFYISFLLNRTSNIIYKDYHPAEKFLLSYSR